MTQQEDQAPDPSSYAVLLLQSPLGRQFLLTVCLKRYNPTLLEQVLHGPVRTSHHGRRRSILWLDDVRKIITNSVRDGQWHTILELSDLDLLCQVAKSSVSFGFDGYDRCVWKLTGEVQDELRPVAEALLAAPATRRWWTPINRIDQRFVAWNHQPWPARSDLARHVREEMTRTRAIRNNGSTKRASAPAESIWWSPPDFAQLTWTTGPFGEVPSIVLGGFVDTLLPLEEAEATIWSISFTDDANVLEIDKPDAWRALVERFPRDVTNTHYGAWHRWTGLHGPWYLPDWELVMDEYDGVHVTVGAFVSSCGRALPVDSGYTMLAGWVPDATLWLRDAAIGASRLGEWHGRPQANWSNVLEQWVPDAV